MSFAYVMLSNAREVDSCVVRTEIVMLCIYPRGILLSAAAATAACLFVVGQLLDCVVVGYDVAAYTAAVMPTRVDGRLSAERLT